jgi:hypothetical protein
MIFDKFSVGNGQGSYVEDVGMAGFGLVPIKSEGQDISFEDTNQTTVSRYTFITYGLGFQITREMYEDGIAATESLRRAGALAFSLRQTQEVVAANVLNRAFSDSYVGGDGKELCATDHPLDNGGTLSNELSVAADLSETSLEQALLDIADFTTDKGLKIAVRARKLIIPSELQFEASRILDGTERYDTANRDINAMAKAGSFPEGFVVNHYLTDADAWFIKTDCPEGLKFFERRPMEFANDSSFTSENARFKATFRGAWGWTDFRSCFGSPGAN